MTYHKYEWTAFTEADLLAGGNNGSDFGCGDRFTMPGTATVTMSSYDDDGNLSGDYWGDWYDGVDDWTGQQATINGCSIGTQMFAEQYHVLQGSDGKCYYLIEIKVKGHSAPGAGDSYFTFYGATPPAGVELCVVQTCNVSGSWVDYSCLGAGASAPPNTPPTFTNVPADGVFCVDENTTLVIDLNASDADGDALTYKIIGGQDASAFTIDANTGELNFVAAPDYESPGSCDGDNNYQVIVEVSDGKGGTQNKCLTVNVCDVDETGPNPNPNPNPQQCIVVEAENMELCYFNVGNDGTYIYDPLQSAAKASYTFQGEAGTYDLSIRSLGTYGGERVTLLVNGQQVGQYHETDNVTVWTDHPFSSIELKAGDVITIVADCGVNRIDNLKICPSEPEPGNLEGRLFVDANKDGVDNSEAGVAGVTVILLDAAGNQVSTTTTAADGSYSFTDLQPGDYSVVFPTEVNGQVLTSQDTGSDDTIDSDASQTTGQTGSVTVVAGATTSDVDAGIVDPETAALKGRVFVDDNDNGVDNSETGVSGVPVRLLDGNGNVVATTTTDASGNYSFDNLSAGDYQVQVPTSVNGLKLVNQNVGSDDTIDSDVDQTTGKTGIISLDFGEVSTDNDAGLVDPGTASLGDRVWLDANKNGVQDANEAGVSGVTVTLYDAAGNAVATDTTDASGNYLFENLDAGNYQVGFANTGNFAFTTANSGSDTVDSDANQSTGRTGTISLGVNEQNLTVDAGLVDPGTSSLGDRVWLDANKNGVQDANEAGVSGVTVTLYDAAGNAVATDTTDASGNYLFENLDAGNYQVGFTNTGNYAFTTANSGLDFIDSDANQSTGRTGTISLGVNEQNLTVDAGLVDPGTASLGDRVWLDSNANGVQDPGEAGVAGVNVTLYDAAGNAVATDTTDASGNYLFENLNAGTYSVGFVAPTGYNLTVANSGLDFIDSDANQSTGRTGNYTLAIGQQNLTVDAGLVVNNVAPEANNDTGMTCADTAKTVDVLANDTDADGNSLTITSVAGQAISEGQTITTSAGTLVTLSGGKLVVNGEAAYAALDIGQQGSEAISYTVSDGNGGSDAAVLNMTFCGDANSIESLCATLPSAGQIQVVDENDPAGSSDEAFTLKLTSGDARIDGVYENAYCLSIYLSLDSVQNGTPVADATAYSSAITCAAAGAVPSGQLQTVGFNGQTAANNLDLISWILNEDFTSKGYSDGEVQAAIWALTDGQVLAQYGVANGIYLQNGAGDADDALEIYNAAIANGEGYVAGDGDMFGLILDPSATNFDQPFIVGVNFDDADCLC